jgi:acetyltransferase-like isoleucine patch superfamily enzyme
MSKHHVMPSRSTGERLVAAVHGRQDIPPDPPDELALADRLRGECSRDELLDLASKHAYGDNEQDARMRRATWRALARRFGHGVRIGRGALAKHPETFEIGNGVVIGEQAFIQGRFDGTCVIGDRVWLGPQSYLDARDLVIEDAVGWGPGAKVLGSQHTALPIDVPIISTDLRIEPVRVRAWADIGVNAVILPGVTVGKGAMVGAGAVVAADVPAFAIVAGVPARFLRWRTGYQPGSETERTNP